MANTETTTSSQPELPRDALIILPVRGTVLFPGVVLPITVGRPKSVAAAQEAVRRGDPIGLLLQRQQDVDDPGPGDLHQVGTVAAVLRYLTAPDGTHHMVCQGQHRFRVLQFLPDYPFLAARIERIGESEVRTPEVEARLLHLRRQAEEAIGLMPQAPAELANAIRQVPSAAALADLVASIMDIEVNEKQEVLEIVDVGTRLRRVSEMMSYRLEVLRLSQQISQQTREKMEGKQREFLLREQLKTIQKELGESDGRGEEVAELEKRIADAKMPPEVEQQAKRELTRLERLPEGAAEYSMMRNYLDWLVELPWSV
ncbi:MAG TPA: LON peptidase substrate-binding domain-containing protein, partial [Stellaceae bacterium]|nr:LON peptidase substrate-binding domain-containing protein [Stellaceae bacterium]